MNLINKMADRAKANKQRIVMPEGSEHRMLQAADKLLNDEIADIILLGNQNEIFDSAKKLDLSNIDKAIIVDPINHDKKDLYTDLLLELRKKRGMTREQADVLVENPLYLAF